EDAQTPLEQNRSKPPACPHPISATNRHRFSTTQIRNSFFHSFLLLRVSSTKLDFLLIFCHQALRNLTCQATACATDSPYYHRPGKIWSNQRSDRFRSTEARSACAVGDFRATLPSGASATGHEFQPA